MLLSSSESIFGENTHAPELLGVDLETVQHILQNMPEDTSEVRAQYLIDRIGTLQLKQKVRLLVDLTPEDFAAFEKIHHEYQDAAVSGMDMGLNPDMTLINSIRQRSRLLLGTARYIVEAEMRRRFLETGEGYPKYWDLELTDPDPQFQDGDGLPRLRDGRDLSYVEAVLQGKRDVMFAFVRTVLNPGLTRNEDPLVLSEDTIGREFANYILALPEPLKSILTLADLRLGLQMMTDRFDNFEIQRTCDAISKVVDAMLESKNPSSNNRM